ncbi:MAG: hypothetical protein ICV86_11610 [Microcoleus sp. T3-bin5]|nr:hypothetical protein [Microcoleus sp. T3-bin5]
MIVPLMTCYLWEGIARVSRISALLDTGFHQVSARNTHSFTHAVSIWCGVLWLWDVPRTPIEFVSTINRNKFY